MTICLNNFFLLNLCFLFCCLTQIWYEFSISRPLRNINKFNPKFSACQPGANSKDKDNPGALCSLSVHHLVSQNSVWTTSHSFLWWEVWRECLGAWHREWHILPSGGGGEGLRWRGSIWAACGRMKKIPPEVAGSGGKGHSRQRMDHEQSREAWNSSLFLENSD